MPIPRWLVLPTAIIVVSVIIAACGGAPPGAAGSASPTAPPSPPAGPLLTVETHGGDCAGGPCGSTIVVEADGRVHATAPVPAELGMLDQATFEGLRTEIAEANFAALKSRPFTDTCPVAFDGQEMIYTFTTATGPERIATCEVVVDPADPLFVAVAAALAATATP